MKARFFEKTFDIGVLEVKYLASELTSKRADGTELNSFLATTPCRHCKAAAGGGPQRPQQQISRKKKFGSNLAERESREAAPNGNSRCDVPTAPLTAKRIRQPRAKLDGTWRRTQDTTTTCRTTQRTCYHALLRNIEARTPRMTITRTEPRRMTQQLLFEGLAKRFPAISPMI